MIIYMQYMYNPPLHLIASSFTPSYSPWYCFSKRIFRIKSTAFFVYGGFFNIFFPLYYSKWLFATCVAFLSMSLSLVG